MRKCMDVEANFCRLYILMCKTRHVSSCVCYHMLSEHTLETM